MRNPNFHSKPTVGWRAVALPLLAVLVLSSGWAYAQVAAGKASASAAASPAVVSARTDAQQRPAKAGKPLWSELSAPQRAALSPLASQWDGLSAGQKRKWLALSRNHHELSMPEQALVHARMDEWVKLSPQQRRTARLNFAESKRLSSDEKQQKWEAYQALSPDARHKLVESAPSLPSGAAMAVRPVPPKKLATVPMGGPNATAHPKLASPNQIDPHTLLPQRNEPVRPRQKSLDVGGAKP